VLGSWQVAREREGLIRNRKFVVAVITGGAFVWQWGNECSLDTCACLKRRESRKKRDVRRAKGHGGAH